MEEINSVETLLIKSRLLKVLQSEVKQLKEEVLDQLTCSNLTEVSTESGRIKLGKPKGRAKSVEPNQIINELEELIEKERTKIIKENEALIYELTKQRDMAQHRLDLLLESNENIKNYRIQINQEYETLRQSQQSKPNYSLNIKLT